MVGICSQMQLQVAGHAKSELDCLNGTEKPVDTHRADLRSKLNYAAIQSCDLHVISCDARHARNRVFMGTRR